MTRARWTADTSQAAVFYIHSPSPTCAYENLDFDAWLILLVRLANEPRRILLSSASSSADWVTLESIAALAHWTMAFLPTKTNLMSLTYHPDH